MYRLKITTFMVRLTIHLIKQVVAVTTKRQYTNISARERQIHRIAVSYSHTILCNSTV